MIQIRQYAYKIAKKHKINGFALPTVLIASIIMLSVLLVSVSSTASIRVSLVTQFYNRLSQNASDAGAVYAKSCLDANSGSVTWTAAKPLRPYTGCNGETLPAYSDCTDTVDPAAEPDCYITVNDTNTVVSTFTVDYPTNGIASNINSVGSIKLLRSSNKTTWRQYTARSKKTISNSTAQTANVSILAVAGGGGGGSFGGGGGGGGFVYNSSLSITSGTYPVTVGSGGAGSTVSDTGVPGTNGTNSIFSSITAIGGGGGGSRTVGSLAGPGSAGGSGGGSSMGNSGSAASGGTATSGQGYNGGQGRIGTAPHIHGGGGGAGAIGGTAVAPNAGPGGSGAANSIIGSTSGQNVSGVYYLAGGGGGGSYVDGTYVVGPGGRGGGGAGQSVVGSAGVAGTANTGGGGGGGGYTGTGGTGGSGIVIISYPTGSISANGGIMAVSGGNTIHTFTSTSSFIMGAAPRSSCLEILNAGESTGSGVYWIYPTGSSGVNVYCDMTNNGGGWTLVMRMANDTTLQYAASYWTAGTLLNQSTVDVTTNTNSVFDSYNQVSGTMIMGCRGANTSCISATYPSFSSAKSLVTGAVQWTPSMTRASWISMFPPDNPAEPYCNIGGVNIQPSVYSKARFGFSSNNENDCLSNDSVWGFGIYGYTAVYCGAGTGGYTIAQSCYQGTLYIR